LATGVYDIGRATAEVRNIHLSGNLAWNNDTFLLRDAAGQLAQRNGTNPQDFRLYNTYTDGANWRRFSIAAYSDGNVYIQTQGAGSGGAGGDLYIAPGGPSKWVFDPNTFSPELDNACDLGRPSNRVRAGYFMDLYHHSTTLLHAGVALGNGAAAAAGTLTNAPAAGNPTKWIPIDDNGTIRYIPAW
jgi:hypothetical protein